MNYERITHLEHILKRPDTYVGSLPRESSRCWIRDGNVFKHTELSVSPGLVKIFDEVLVNAIDQWSLHPKKVSEINVSVLVDGEIRVENIGVAIPIKKHEKEGIWIPELIFGHLLTSSNYNDDEQRVTGGRNGYGAKLANVFSTKFWIEICDGKKIYQQIWTKNMTQVSTPEISPASGPIRVRVGFIPDWPRFGGQGQLAAVIEKRTWDAALWCTKCRVSFNGTHLLVATLEDFVRAHVGERPVAKMHTDNFDIIVCHSTEGGFQHVSFVNGIATTKGGTHVDKITRALVDAIGSDKRLANLKPAQIKSELFVFVRAVIINPTFASQTKAECTSKITESIDFKPKFIKDVLGTGVLDALIVLNEAKLEKELKKTDGTKKARITGIPKLDDANWAGTHRSTDCTLIITEGDSAKALAVAGLSVVGRDRFGVFPLRGKPRNVRDASAKQVAENEEFNNLKKILGLQHGRVYNSLRDLRYGRLMIMTDADLDGSHIKGLVLNMFHVYWPQLIELGFVVAMVTPIIKAGKVWFFTEDEFKAAQTSGNVKYYKGLGTSTSTEAREYFGQIDRLTVAFSSDPEMNESMSLAFAKAQTDDRKSWLTNHMADPPPSIPYGHVKTLSVSEFIHKDLANFSSEDIKRSIPHVADGLKPSQRKVIFACLKKNLVNDMKVAQLAGYVAEQTAYHHGEASLQGTIVNLAQNFVGSNNLNLLEPSGQFGTRLAGGKDAASARYIFTRLNSATRKIFDPCDNFVLKYVVDDGQQVEPEHYAPIVPMILVNGAEGIGTGFSCFVPPYDIEIVKHNIECALDRVAMTPMVPHFKGFKGKIVKTKEHTWVLEGCIEHEGARLKVSELPPGKWTQDFKEHLDGLLEKGLIQKFENHSTDASPAFTIWGYTGSDAIKDFGLSRTIHTSNMYLIGPNGAVKKYASPEDILIDYMEIRLKVYKKRKAWLLKKFENEIEWLSERARFILAVIEGNLKVMNVPLAEVQTQLESQKYNKENWDKLLDIKTHQYTQEEVCKLLKQIEDRKKEHEDLKGTSVVQLWKNNLREM